MGVCCDTLYTYDQSATDPDGDSLVYSLYDPFSMTGPCPSSATVAYMGPFSGDEPITTVSGFNLDSETGMLTAEPNVCLEQSVMGIQIDEYIGGVLASTVRRDNRILVTPLTPAAEDTSDVSIIEEYLEMKIFPNPSKGIFTVQTSELNYSFEVFLPNGQSVFFEDQLSGNQTIKIDQKSKGLYFYQIKSDHKIRSGRLVIE